MIGAALLSEGEQLAFSVAKVLGLDAPKTCDWLDVVSYAPSKSMIVKDAGCNREILEGVMKIIGIPLDNPELLLQAMVRIFPDHVKVEVDRKTRSNIPLWPDLLNRTNASSSWGMPF